MKCGRIQDSFLFDDMFPGIHYPPSGLHVDRKSTRLNSSHTEIYTLSLHDALPICYRSRRGLNEVRKNPGFIFIRRHVPRNPLPSLRATCRSEEHTSELQSHRDLHSFPTRRSSDLLQEQTRPE